MKEEKSIYGLMAEFENKHQDGPAAVHRYIARLAQYIIEERERRAFINDAHRRSGLFGERRQEIVP